jgi:hypothetical protein
MQDTTTIGIIIFMSITFVYKDYRPFFYFVSILDILSLIESYP